MATTAEPQPTTTAARQSGPTKAKGWGTEAPDQPLRPMEFERRALRSDDVAIRITYADRKVLDAGDGSDARYQLLDPMAQQRFAPGQPDFLDA